MKRRGVRQFVKFAIVGASGFLMNLCVFTALQIPLSVDARQHNYNLLFSIGFLAGGVSNYFLNRIWTFRSSGHPIKEGGQFMAVSVVALCFGLLVSYWVKPFLG